MTVTTTYPYRDTDGTLLYEVERRPPKHFVQRRPDGHGGWDYNLTGVERVPYRLPELAGAEDVFVVEGEKDADRLAGLGLVATTNPQGANFDWPASWARYFAGVGHAYVIPDNDPPGRCHAEQVAGILSTVVADTRIVELPGVAEKGDVSDWLDAGHDVDDLWRAAEAASAFHPPPSPNGATPAGRRQWLNLTDVGNAGRVVQHHGDALRYVGSWGAWLTWDGRRWRRDTRGEVFEHAKAIPQTIRNEAVAAAGDDRKAIYRWAHQSEGAARIEAMVRLARSDPSIAIDPDDLDADPWALNVGNGIVDLRTGLLAPHDRDALMTKLAPVDYDPDAPCPTWTAFLERILPDPAVRAFVQRAVGYSLTGVTTEQVLLFMFGSGANGKSTMTETLLAMLGDYARQADPELLLATDQQHPTGIADLMGARFVVASEVDDGRRLAEATVKQLTGSDTIKARFMRQDFFEFKPTHKFWLHANHRPIVRGTDLAIWRRLRLIPFGVTIPPEEQDRRLPERLRAELPGILTWAVKGCVLWGGGGGLGEPEAVKVATDRYRADMDMVGGFLAESCVTGEGTLVGGTELYQAYTAWCSGNGDKAMSQRAFGRVLTEKGFEREKRGTARRWHWLGVGLVNLTNPSEPMEPPDDANGFTPGELDV